MMKKFLSMLLVCVLVLGLIPAAFAAEENTLPWDTFIPSSGAQIPEDARIGRSTLYSRARDLIEVEPNDDFGIADRLLIEDVVTATMDGDDVDIFTFTVDKLSDVMIVGAAEADSLRLVTGRLEDDYSYVAEHMGLDDEYGLYGYAIYTPLPMGTYYIVAQDEYSNTSEYNYAITLRIEGHAHEWGEGVVTKPATYTTTGTKVYTCESCGQTKNETIPVIPHTHNYINMGSTAATCVEKGFTTYTCSICNGSYKDNFTSALNHTWVNNVCTRCGIAFANQFVDVAKTSYYYDPVIWAASNGITSGDGRFDTFNPTGNCTRGQVVTFLWRSQGQPEPTNTVNPFTDVKPTDYYYKAVLWAAEKGITVGMTATTFAPKDTCTRAQVVTFLWRALKEPVPTITPSFSDVPAGKYYFQPVAWAVENEITVGMTSTTFAPDNTCTRGQIVTFLYRAFN